MLKKSSSGVEMKKEDYIQSFELVQFCQEHDCLNWHMAKWTGGWIDKWYCEEHRSKND